MEYIKYSDSELVYYKYYVFYTQIKSYVNNILF